MSPVDTPPASPKSASSSKSGSMSGTHTILAAPAQDLPPPAVSRVPSGTAEAEQRKADEAAAVKKAKKKAGDEA